MALILCPECGKKIFDKAKFCPQCGYPIQEIIRCDNNLLPEKIPMPKLSLDAIDAIIAHACQYFEIGAFSKKEIMDLLIFEGYSNDVACYVVERLGVKWREQALGKLHEYLRIKEFSRKEMTEQLEFDGFTHEEIIFAINTAYKE